MNIDIEKLTPEDVGRHVLYRQPWEPRREPQVGMITSWNHRTVFVNFGTPGTTSMGCTAGSLTFESDGNG